MKFNVFVKDGLKLNEYIRLIESNFENCVLSKSPDYVFTIGGDGTFLDAIYYYGDKPTYIPINKGTLGFYSSWLIDELDLIKQTLKNPHVIKCSMLDVSFTKNNIRCVHNCLNEVTLINPINTQILDIHVNGLLLEKFRGTGVCVSTPTGSTAYNKSLGGSIISHEKKLFQLVRIAAINNIKYRTLENPIILGEDEVLRFDTSVENFENTILTVDRKTYNLNGVQEININMSDRYTKILVREDNNFYERVKASFIGNDVK